MADRRKWRTFFTNLRTQRRGDEKYAKMTYIVDFELCDDRASDIENSVVQIYLGFEYTDIFE